MSGAPEKFALAFRLAVMVTVPLQTGLIFPFSITATAGLLLVNSTGAPELEVITGVNGGSDTRSFGGGAKVKDCNAFLKTNEFGRIPSCCEKLRTTTGVP